ncbi:MAG: hypothetical protein IJU78_00720, partial [Clostridia bacterium]|nr:hypothetical protein [Clostridia bacterium]
SYDAAGNLLTAQEWRPQEGIASTASYSYNYLNQLASQTVNGRSSSFAYNADGIRTAKTVGRRLVGYLLDGGNVIGETEGGELVATYQRGVNLISCIDPRDTGFEETYYLYNAHGDVVQLADEYGNLTKTYEYDAFGNEKNKTSDPNPFRYCGEYYDAESGSYYLRARYYNPSVGRFTQEDTHWNTGNMIYGDAPQKIGEYKDPLGVSRYAYAPQTTAIMQAGNLYAYCGGNPLKYVDPTGQEWYHWVIGGVIVAIAAVAVVATAGGAIPALSAINAVAFGSAAATTVTTVAAGALIGSGTVMTCALITADISSWESFGDSADWTTVAFAAGGFVVGGAYGYMLAADARKVSSASPHKVPKPNLDVKFNDSNLQHEYSKHAKDYGIYGNWNNANKLAFEQAIKHQVNTINNPILGTFRGTIPVYHFYDPVTGLDTIINLDGTFRAGWILSAKQVECLFTKGNVQ